MIEDHYKIKPMLPGEDEDLLLFFVEGESPGSPLFTGSKDECQDFAWMMNRGRRLRLLNEIEIQSFMEKRVDD